MRVRLAGWSVCSSINMEWCRQNGDRLSVKLVQCHDTCTPIAFFFLWNEGPPDTFVSELGLLGSIFKVCWECALLNGDESVPPAIILPEFSLRKSLPQVKSGKTNGPMFSANIPQQLQNAGKVMHIEVGRRHAELIKRLVEIGKDKKVFAAMWGKQVHPSEVLEADAPMESRMNLASMAQDHASFIFGSQVESGEVDRSYSTRHEGGCPAPRRVGFSAPIPSRRSHCQLQNSRWCDSDWLDPSGRDGRALCGCAELSGD